MTPRLRLMTLVALAGLPFLAAVWSPVWTSLGLLLILVVAVVALVDLILSPSLSRVDIVRQCRPVLSVGARNAVTIQCRNRNARRLALEIHDEPPEPSAYEDLPATMTLAPGKAGQHVYYVIPHHRGRNEFKHLFLRCRSRLGLWLFTEERLQPTPVRIYPDIQAVRGAELLARQNRLAEAGVRLARLRGRGSEFDRLREYRREDELRNVDWKATSRYQTLISREYVVERNQNIILLLDCGRSMCNRDGGVTHFDRVLNAALLLTYVALSQGDTVGLMACSNKLERWVRPVRGAGGVERLIGQVYDLEPQYVATDYHLMVEQLQRRYRKRSLVVLLTHALDEVHLAGILQQMRRLRNPHLVLGTFLRNSPLEERSLAIPKTNREAFQIAAAVDMVEAQQRQLTERQKAGVLILDTLPEQLTSRLISQYLDIKARHLL